MLPGLINSNTHLSLSSSSFFTFGNSETGGSTEADAIKKLPHAEENIRRSLLIARGDAAVFFQRPISAGLLVAGLLLFVAVRVWRHKHRQ